MNFKNIQELFDYLLSMNGTRIRQDDKSCSIWLPNGEFICGKFESEIDFKSKDLLTNDTFFIYNENEIACQKNYETCEFIKTPGSFLSVIFNKYPEIAPLEYKLSYIVSDLQNALDQLQSMRIQNGALKKELENNKKECSELKKHYESREYWTERNKSELNKQTERHIRLLTWINDLKKIITIEQIKKVEQFTNSDSAFGEIEYGFAKGIIKLTYSTKKWGSADLEGVELGYVRRFVYLDKLGNEIDKEPNGGGFYIGNKEFSALKTKMDK
jgi:hypothetical protein